MTDVSHRIAGEPLTSERTIDVLNPATAAPVRRLAMADTATVQRAIDAARDAQPAWRDMPPAKRAQVMYRFKTLLERDADEICALISEEHGKVLEDAMGELKRGIENVEYACGVPELLKGEYSHNAGSGIDTWSNHQPLGVVAGVTPFNFPAMVPLWMYPMALACGNAFILKPSEQAPSAAVKMAELLDEAGLPKGLFSVVHGDREAVDALIEAPEVRALSFVGSTPVARKIYEGGTQQGKRVQALGGAKNHAVVLPDADIDNAASTLIGAAYGSAGERCMAISVAVCVGDATADALVERLAAQARELKIGPGTERGLDMGALINEGQRDKVAGYIGQGAAAGAELVVDGREHPLVEGSPGYFLGATLFDRVTPEMSIYRDEIFGPVLCVVRVETFEDAIALINAHQYGNGTCVFTRDGEAGRRFADAIEVGMVGINVPLPVPVAFHSFGGWKDSLFGDLHAYGPDAVRFYTRRKAISQRWPKRSDQETAQFSFPS
ncbi:methylmalonate-semialdehyde dehydrogenase [acylating] [Chromohalobacter marismortui]|uniref:methylmalonate-semialdehyde dehydrogenase (CoA acylating) n=1 Tax=Chromohalobacter marismortui TaxID=42055 RepID=A0A4V3F2P2_9GAMM|nr:MULTISPECIES: CoA-acylating methylmalonate-semialdehyde dehydrogenase [Chromohalobacter]MCI0511025.1 CoA-acylating methylmalonate-semialdehyde dehydrogenase [Chromohalobacter sp.]MCI0594381.1 CoA-acylating methylmalonate-semialdehyde dehydrogenase [Chromohalobacter sp.]TDU18146.1 methylmalonate-semialdehyde dehydrogenase [acylating] [Chromohalobacter marismortui]